MRARRGRVPFIFAALALLVSGCASTVLPEAVTEQADHMKNTWDVFVPTAIFVWALVWVLVIWVIFKYRRRHDNIPSQKQYFTGLEIFYTIVPLLMVFGLYGWSLYNQNKITALDDNPDVVIEVIGFQWDWQFNYQEGDIVKQPIRIQGATTSGERALLMLPVGQTVRLDLHANDVNHSFWVPNFLEKRDLIPGIDNAIDIDVKKEGEWVGRCAEFCGLNHWQMAFDVQAISADKFAQWAAEQGTAQAGQRAEEERETLQGESTEPDEGPGGDVDGGTTSTSTATTTTTEPTTTTEAPPTTG